MPVAGVPAFSTVIVYLYTYLLILTKKSLLMLHHALNLIQYTLTRMTEP